MKEAFGTLFYAALILMGGILLSGLAYEFVGWYLAIPVGLGCLYALYAFVKKNKESFGF